jgi:LacI family transcriptional regulator/LacI family repressor for deo operon, udp, cdd, tsx, nupC, and nupG
MPPIPANKRRRQPTIRDVARHAGVGVGTVSRVLNGSSSVSEDADVRVRRAVEELGYRRSQIARSLSVGRSHALGVVAPFFTTPSVIERLRGVVDRLAEKDYDVVLFSVENSQQRSDALRDFARRDRVDGLLVISLPLDDDEIVSLRRDQLPVVLIDVGHPELPHVVIDDVRGGELAAEHLLAKGHTRIGFVGDAPDAALGFTSSERRRGGYRRALAAAGIEPPDALERRGRSGREAARDLALALLSRDDPPSAVFAASDLQAFGVLEAAEVMGLRVPDDLAVIGFDDIEMAAVMGLTTVRQPLYETGARGADLLLAALAGGAQPVQELKTLRVIERRTT